MSEELNISEWNGGQFTNLRVHEIEEELKIAMTTNNLPITLSLLKEKNHVLYGFQSRSGHKFNDLSAQQKEIRNRLTSLSDKINTYKQARLRKPTIQIPPELMDEIESLRYILDQVLYDSGLLTRTSKDSRQAFG